MTTMIDCAKWEAWLTESGQKFDVVAFHYDVPQEFPLSVVTGWLESWPALLKSFLERFTPDDEDIAQIQIRLAQCSSQYECELVEVMRGWLERHQSSERRQED